MKTKTGLTIIHNGKRVEVYTPDEMKAERFTMKLKSILNNINIKL